jgi:hypothetical protein
MKVMFEKPFIRSSTFLTIGVYFLLAPLSAICLFSGENEEGGGTDGLRIFYPSTSPFTDPL